MSPEAGKQEHTIRKIILVNPLPWVLCFFSAASLNHFVTPLIVVMVKKKMSLWMWCKMVFALKTILYYIFRPWIISNAHISLPNIVLIVCFLASETSFLYLLHPQNTRPAHSLCCCCVAVEVLFQKNSLKCATSWCRISGTPYKILVSRIACHVWGCPNREFIPLTISVFMLKVLSTFVGFLVKLPEPNAKSLVCKVPSPDLHPWREH